MRCICMRMQIKIEARFQIKSFTPETQLKYIKEMAFWVAFYVYSNNNKENE